MYRTVYFSGGARRARPIVSDIAICVIEDDDDVRKFIRATLERAGFRVLDASNGEYGIRIVENVAVSAVVTDIVMPGRREGLETITLLRRRFPQLPILAISGHGKIGPNDYLRFAAALGAHEVLAKPFTPEDLVAKVRLLLERAR
jgi:DNA-binding response OmpR family regulator